MIAKPYGVDPTAMVVLWHTGGAVVGGTVDVCVATVVEVVWPAIVVVVESVVDEAQSLDAHTFVGDIVATKAAAGSNNAATNVSR